LRECGFPDWAVPTGEYQASTFDHAIDRQLRRRLKSVRIVTERKVVNTSCSTRPENVQLAGRWAAKRSPTANQAPFVPTDDRRGPFPDWHAARPQHPAPVFYQYVDDASNPVQTSLSIPRAIRHRREDWDQL